MGHETAVQLCHFTAIAEVASAAFGGGSDKKPKTDQDLSVLDTNSFIAGVNKLGSVG